MTENLVKLAARGCKAEEVHRALVVTMERTTCSTAPMVEATEEMEGKVVPAVRVAVGALAALEGG